VEQHPSALDEALRPGAIRSVYQPIVELDSGRVMAYEALARGPVGPLERPDLLFAAAREAGRLAELDELCRVAAFRGAVDHDLLAPLTVFVNVEPEVLDSAPLDDLLAIAETAPGDLRVVLEITERALAARPAELLRTVERVRELGWGLALDDVGADSMSLAFLPLLAPDVVKLDLRLVQDRPGPAIAEIMNAVNAHAERTGALILAEGIETEEHLATARALGATLGQGWLFGRPGPGAVTDRAAGVLRLPRPPSHGGPGGSPFACLPDTVSLRRSSKALLIELSKQLEREALRLGETCVVASTFQEARHFTPATARRYQELVDRTGFVCAIGEDLPVEPIPGLRGATLDPADEVRGEWDVVVLGPHFAAALLARDLGDDGPDLARRFEYGLTYDRNAVIGAASALLSRVAPRPNAVAARDIPGARTDDPRARSAVSDVVQALTVAQHRIDELGHTDPLTGLIDRPRLADRVEAALWDARAGDGALAVLFVDVDAVTTVNGTWGHATGDELLVTAVERMRTRVRRADLLARLGGHEFAVGLLDLEPATARRDAARIADEIAEVVRTPFRLGDGELPVAVRVGVAVFPEDGDDFAALLRAADVARYERRSTGSD
jgi:diguanylate cyclase (GGDEF)-like protein